MATGRKPLPRLPVVDRGNRNAQIRGNLLQGDVAFQPPVAECGRKAGADVTVELRLLSHGESLPDIRVSGKGLNPASAWRVIVVDEMAMLMWPSNARAVLGITRQSADDVRSGTSLKICTS